MNKQNNIRYYAMKKCMESLIGRLHNFFLCIYPSLMYTSSFMFTGVLNTKFIFKTKLKSQYYLNIHSL